MRAVAEVEGVSPSQIVLEERATSTLESAEQCARIITARHWRRVLIVTDRYHLPRALLTFRAFGVRAHGSPPAGGRGDTSLAHWIYLHVREIAAVPWYAARLAMARRTGSDVR
jgi:uncharacterized SAM-binding protein YcdF (DUF218 family)